MRLPAISTEIRERTVSGAPTKADGDGLVVSDRSTAKENCLVWWSRDLTRLKAGVVFRLFEDSTLPWTSRITEDASAPCTRH
jgi:hypothetical protein